MQPNGMKGGFCAGIARWWNNRPENHNLALLSAVFVIFFLLLLLPIPASGSVLGTVDNLLIPAIGNFYLDQIRAAFTGEFAGRGMYPALIVQYGESSIFVAGTFVFFRVLGLNDIYALYLTQVSLLSLMAFATMLLAREYSAAPAAALLAGFFFTVSNFVWADIDHLVIHYYFLPLLCVYFLKKSIRLASPRDLLAAGVFGGLQMYTSVQVFIYQTFMVGLLILFNGRDFRTAFPLRRAAQFILPYVLIPVPLFLFYLNTVVNLAVVNPFPLDIWENTFSLQLVDFLRTLPHKLIDYPFVGESAGGLPRVAHSAFVGLAAPLLAILGLRRLNRSRLELGALVLFGVIFALGTSINVGGREITSPLAYFYKVVPLASYLRIQQRSYTVALLAVGLLAGLGWQELAGRISRWRSWLSPAVLLVLLAWIGAENISSPLNRYEIKSYPEAPAGYVEFFHDKPDALILDLPSHSTVWPGLIDETIYLLWQTKHDRNILGGVAAYYPKSRMLVQRQSDALPSPTAFRFFRSMGVTHFVWHKSDGLVCHPYHSERGCDPQTGRRFPEEAQGYDWLDTSPALNLVFENEVLKIYELRPGGDPP